MSYFKYYENDYELAVLQMLTEAGWEYECGYDIHRENHEIILVDDFREYLLRRYDSFSDGEVNTLVSYITSFSNQSLYRSMKETYRRLMNGYTLRRDDGSDLFIDFLDTETDTNVFKAVNQFEYEEYKNRRPDIILFVNGILVPSESIIS